jgi:hypothetical protein
MFRFSIRDVLWLTVVVAVLVAWWLDYRHQEQKWRNLNAPISHGVYPTF